MTTTMPLVVLLPLLLHCVIASAKPFPSPSYHLPARCEEGDINALFQYRGQWHLMQQWHLRPKTAIGHAHSPDLLRWTRLPDALESGASGDEQCYDGSPSLVAGADGTTLEPVLMIDGGCGMKGPGGAPCMESSGNDTGGVLARPMNLSDPTLSQWTKEGPLHFAGCDGSAGPSPMWKNGDKYNLIGACVFWGKEAGPVGAVGRG